MVLALCVRRAPRDHHLRGARRPERRGDPRAHAGQLELGRVLRRLRGRLRGACADRAAQHRARVVGLGASAALWAARALRPAAAGHGPARGLGGGRRGRRCRHDHDAAAATAARATPSGLLGVPRAPPLGPRARRFSCRCTSGRWARRCTARRRWTASCAWPTSRLFKLAEWGLVVLLAAHLAGGVRLLLLEFGPPRACARTGSPVPPRFAGRGARVCACSGYADIALDRLIGQL